jgi:deoxyguanosine kinase
VSGITTTQNPHSFIAVEGPIGVGKTTLAKRLAETFNVDTLLEDGEANPFLERFYQNRKQAALPTQLYFLFQRAKKIQALRQNDLFEPVRVADFLMEKDRLFARFTLDADELHLYELVYDQLIINAPTPDLVVYLQASPDVLMRRIEKRGLTMERAIDRDYLIQLNEAYTHFFHFYDEAPLLIVNAEELDWVDNEIDYNSLVEYITQTQSGRHYFNPQSTK